MSSDQLSFFGEGQVLLFNKPLYWTSFDLVNKVRIILKNTLGEKKLKVGHAGTLDPLATGLLIICTGRATKKIDEFRDLDKEYVADIQLGATTPSFDLETETDKVFPVDHITCEKVMEALNTFLGEQKQMPPIYSAKLIEGKRAYEFARKGVEKKLEPVTVNFHELELLSCELPKIRVRMVCSKGTYVRSFARDIGTALDSGACLTALERTAIGPYRINNAFDIEKFQEYVNQFVKQ
jgi:tRNA pseudouridine55 synthase